MMKNEIELRINEEYFITINDSIFGNIVLRVRKPQKVVIRPLGNALQLQLIHGVLTCDYIDIEKFDEVLFKYDFISRFINDNGNVKEIKI